MTVTSLLERAYPKRRYVSKTAPAPYVAPKLPTAPVLGKGRRSEDDPQVKRRRRRRRALLKPLPEKA